MTATDPSTTGGGTTSENPTTGVVDPDTTSPSTTNVDPTTTTDDSTSSDPSTTTPDPSTTGGSDLSCEAYCDIYVTACKDFSEYQNEQACLDQCSQWPIGDAAATEGDSLGCRTYHVTVASQTDANVHCPHAGPSGAGVCAEADAPTCADYCAEYFKNCLDDLNAYDDEADCMDQCSHWYLGIDGATLGDSVGCREYHAGAAFGDPDTHCPHAGPGGANVCVVQ